MPTAPSAHSPPPTFQASGIKLKSTFIPDWLSFFTLFYASCCALFSAFSTSSLFISNNSVSKASLTFLPLSADTSKKFAPISRAYVLPSSSLTSLFSYKSALFPTIIIFASLHPLLASLTHLFNSKKD